MPHGEEVRSLSLPKSGLATIDSSEPTLVTSASRSGAASMPTRPLTVKASEASSGARNDSDVPMLVGPTAYPSGSAVDSDRRHRPERVEPRLHVPVSSAASTSPEFVADVMPCQ